MPKRRRTTSRKKKATPKKDVWFPLNKRLQTPLPTQVPVRMRYYDTFAMNPGIGTLANYVFQANGMYDPNITGVGHQPRGFDQLMQLYDHYVVLSARIVVSCVNSSGILVENKYSVMVKDGAVGGLPSTPADIHEYGLKDISSVIYGAPHRSVKGSVNVAEFLGRGDAMSDSQLKGSTAANPAEGCYFIISYWSDANSDPVSTTFWAELEFDAVLIEPKQVSQS